jgi:hypothetical protein
MMMSEVVTTNMFISTPGHGSLEDSLLGETKTRISGCFNVVVECIHPRRSSSTPSVDWIFFNQLVEDPRAMNDLFTRGGP